MKKINFCLSLLICFTSFFMTFETKVIKAQDVLVAEFTFYMTGPNYYESQPLQAGGDYYLKVSGTYTYGSNNLVDAAYYIIPPPIIAWTDHDGIFAWDDGDNVFPEGYLQGYEDYNHRPTPDVYNPDHIYYYYFTSDGTTELFQWVDGGGYGDNSGSLSFQIWSTEPPVPPTSPVVSDIPDATIINKFVQYSLDEYVTDPNNLDSEIQWTFSGYTNLIVNYNARKRIVKISAPSGWTGSETITFKATDPDGNYDTDDATITVGQTVSQNYSLSFNGTDNYLEISNEQNFDFGGGSFSISVWFKTTAISDGQLVIFMKSDRPLINNNYYVLGAISDRVEFNSNSDPHPGMFAAISYTQVDDGIWHNLVGVRNGTDVILYIDGVTNSTQTQPWDINRSTDNSGALRFGSGAYYEYNLQVHPEHKIDEVTVWNRALTQQEIQEMMITTFNPSTATGLVAYWNFNEGSGTTVNDLSGNINTGTINGATWSIDSYPVPSSPVVSDIPDQTITKNFVKYSLDDYVTDPNNLDSEITWSFTGNTNLIIQYDPLVRSVRISAPKKWYGSEVITFTATDPEGKSDSDDATISKLLSTSSELVVTGNYPNPFNPSTSIEFVLSKSEQVSIKIYNQLGQEIATLVSEELEEGSHRYEWDANGLSSGIYYYIIQAGDVVKVNKCLLIK